MSDREKLLADIGIAACLVIAAAALSFVITDCSLKRACMTDDGAVEETDCYAVIPCKDCPPSTMCDWKCIR